MTVATTEDHPHIKKGLADISGDPSGSLLTGLVCSITGTTTFPLLPQFQPLSIIKLPLFL